MLKNKAKTTIILVIILITVVAGVGYYFYSDFNSRQDNPEQPTQAQTPEEKLLEFKNLNENLSQEMLEKYKQEFATNKNLIINNPQALNPSYWLQIARLKKYVQDYDGAKDIYLFLISKDANNHTAEANLADLYFNYLKNYNQAARHYWQAAQTTPNNQIKFLYYRNLADIYAFKLKNQRKDFEDKMREIHNDEYFKDNPDFYSMLAKYYENVGDNELAIEYLEKALKLAPDSQPIKEEIDYLRHR